MRPATLGDDHYRVAPEFADAGVTRRFEFYRHLFAYAEAVRRLPTGAHVLELGAGEGYGSAYLRDNGITVVASDLAVQALQHARQRYGGIAAAASASALPFRAGSFDAVVAFQVIEHLTDAPVFLREVRRVLRPGGLLLLSTPNRRLRLLPFQSPWNPYHVHEYRAAELRRLLRRHLGSAQVFAVLPRPDLLELERARVRQRPFFVYGGMLRRRLFGAKAGPVRAQAAHSPEPSGQSIAIALEDFALTPHAERGVDLFAVVRVRR